MSNKEEEVHVLSELILDGRELKALNLLTQGAFSHLDMVRQDAAKNTPMHWAAKLGCPSVIKALAERGALCCKMMRNDKDKTPYDYALENGLSYEILNLLNPYQNEPTNDYTITEAQLA